MKRLVDRNLRASWWTLALTLTLGCSSIDSILPGEADASTRAEGGSGSMDGSTTPMPAPEGLAYDDVSLSSDRSDVPAAAAETPLCNDALASGGALALDCENPSCQYLASCCVGRGDCCGETTANLAPPSLMNFVGCGTNVLDCLGGASGRLFGSPTPSITADGTFAPGGDGNFDSGLVLDDVVDLRSTRLELKAHFVVPTECGPGCLEGAAVSVSTQDLFDTTTRVDMLAGLVLSGSRRQVSLIVAGRDVQSWSADEATTWTLRLTPDGLVQVLAGDRELLSPEVGYIPAGAAQVVLSGHDLNPTPGRRVAGLSGLEIAASRCDIPTGWSDHRDLVLRERGRPPALTTPVSGSSLARDDAGDTWAALLIDNKLFLAKRPGTDPSELNLLSTFDSPSLSPPAGSTLGSPALLTGSGNPVVLVPLTTNGTSSLRWGSVDASTGEVTLAPDALLAANGDVRAYERPTVARVDASRVVLIVRRVYQDGGSDLGVYVASESAMAPRELLGLHLNDALSASSAPGYDADEVGGLALVGQDHAWQLYYARRRGARWSIGLLVSDDLIYWRHAEDGESVLLPDGSAREAVGVREPAVTFANERVTLSYLGLDGSLSWPRFVTRNATANGVWR